MKRKLLIRCMTAMAILLTPACTNDFGLEGIASSEVDSEEVEVTFTISAEGAQALTRANEVEGGGPGQWQTTIGKGTKIDMLVYAVYNEKYERLDQYGSTEIPKELENSKALLDESTHEGQKIEYVGGILNEGKSKEITLRLMRNKTYRIAFWAQSSETTAFNTSDLEKVKVIYENAKNNDELRDAFCKVETFTVTPSTSSRTVVLTRPMAQVNVGTTGADYKHIVDNGYNVAYSTITLSGVAQYINVVTDEIDDTNLLREEKAVTFDWAALPAFINMEEIPTEKDDLVGSNENSTGEEFLYVDLNNDGEIEKNNGYKTAYPTLGEKGEFLTETFKYLSMCYVLVPASSVSSTPSTPEAGEGGAEGVADEAAGDSKTDSYASTVLDWVKFSFGVNSGTASFDPIRVNLVPVHRNWRTNLLGGLYGHNPDNPDTPPTDPDDPTTVFKPRSFFVYLDPIYDGEYTTKDEGDSWIVNPDQSAEDAEETPANDNN